MKHTPIEPKHKGCLCCPPAGYTLDKDSWLEVGFGSVTLIIKYPDGSSIFREYIGGMDDYEDHDPPTVRDLEREYGSKFEGADCITLFFNKPLSDETYEYNHDDGEWYLIAQGRGFA